MEENTAPPLERRCPACGAAMPQEARFCGACGMESLPAIPPTDGSEAEVEQAAAPASALAATAATPADASPAPAPAVTPAPPAAAMPTNATAGAGQADDVEGRICPWCGAVNPLDAVRCVACDAAFPTPEGNEALERAAQARIRSMESDLKQPRGGWWPFRVR